MKWTLENDPDESKKIKKSESYKTFVAMDKCGMIDGIVQDNTKIKSILKDIDSVRKDFVSSKLFDEDRFNDLWKRIKPVMESNEYIDGVVREYSGFRQIMYMYACYKIEGHI